MDSTPNDIEMLDVDPSDDDALSLTSTLPDAINSDEEWTAEGILAEGDVHGVRSWLVEWTGYPLAEATWEPRSHVQGELLRIWEERKQSQDRGEEERFDLKIWRDALAEQFRAKGARHEKRNQKRLRLGLQPSVWEQSADELLQLNLDFYPEFETRGEISGDEKSLNGDHEGDGDQDNDNNADNNEQESLDREPPDNITSDSSQSHSLRIDDNVGSLRNEDIPPEALDESNMIHPPSPEPTSTSPPLFRTSSPSYTAPGPAQVSTQTLCPTTTSAPSTITPSTVNTQPTQRKQSTTTSEGRSNSLAGSSNEKLTGLKSRANKTVNPMGGKAPVNVFAGGSTRKARPTLLDAASDTSREPKLVNLRQQRLIQQGRRDKENNAPAKLPKRLISLDPKVPTEDVNTNQQMTYAESPTKASQNPSAAPQISPASSGQNDRTESRPMNLKRKKSVRFDDVVTYKEPADADSTPSPFSVEDFRGSFPSQEDQDISPLQEAGTMYRPPTPPRNSQLGGSQPWTSIETRSVTKRCMFGPKSSKHIDIVFKGIPKQTSHSWLADFTKCTHLVFGHTCMAPDFRSQSQSLRQGPNLASGSLCCPTDHGSLENLTQRLDVGSKGILCYFERFCILLFPAMCADWDFEPVPSHSAGNLLKFAIFEPTPLMHKDSFARRNSQEMQALPRGLNHFLHLDSLRLVPSALSNPSAHTHNVFIAFPTPSRVQEARFITTWLRVSSKTELHIYSSSIPGDWHRFRGTGIGTMIIHEDMISKIRLFPGIAEMLRETAHSGNYAIFTFQQALAQFGRFPSSLQKSPMGDIILYRILPPHKVIMITPSFILSQPQEAYDFIRWFRNDLPTNGTSYRTKLAVCSDITDWVRHLAVEEANRGPTRPHRVHSHDLQAWLGLWQQFEDLVAKSAKESESDNFLLFAPESIDGNDEQSLVNWFGSWTVNHLDIASRFFVLGSNCTQVPRMTREMKILAYAADADDEQPDVAYETVLELASQLTDPQNRPLAILQAPAVPTAPKGALQFIENDSASVIKNCLQSINQNSHNPMALIYNRPVAYWHPDMPWRFGDMNSEFGTFTNWFSYFNALKANSKLKNTYMGLFYTVNSSWKSNEVLADRTPIRGLARRPWIAIFRAREPHKKPWRATELLIWDPGYSKQFLDRPRIYERDLIEAQQELIKLVIQENRVKNPALPFDKVWLAGPDRCYTSPYTNPLDICLDTLEVFVKDLKTWVPSPREHMPNRGWCCVEENAGPLQQIQSSVNRVEPDQKLNMIFHPPPGRQMGHPSRCRNHLYKEMMRAASQPSPSGTVIFRFAPTHEWYSRQKEEDRGFSHICVESWKKIFSTLKIHEGKQD